jgi:hypothetical protein
VFDTSLSQHSELDDFATESTRKLHALGLQLKAISSQQLDRPVQEQEIAEWMRILSETRDTLMGSANDTGTVSCHVLIWIDHIFDNRCLQESPRSNF